MRGEEGDTQYVPGACATEHQGGASIAVLKALRYKCALVSSVNLEGLTERFCCCAKNGFTQAAIWACTWI
jgi:hypothetical protein